MAFSPIGAEQTFTVPPGVSTIHAVAVGGRGGGATGGYGAIASGDVPVMSGETLYIEVAGNGESGPTVGHGPWAGGFNGGGTGLGGGGGASDVRTLGAGTPGSLGSRLIIAGGGGGSGGTEQTGTVGSPPPSYGSPPPPTSLGLGTEPGGDAGQPAPGAQGGRAGTATAGGAPGAGEGTYQPPSSFGTLGQGGDGEGSDLLAGGGGGGLYGGGGGAAVSIWWQWPLQSWSGGGGGGSSGFGQGVTNGTLAIDATGQPSVTLTYAQDFTGTATVGKPTVGGTLATVPVGCNGPGGATCKLTLTMSLFETIKGGHVVAITARRAKTRKTVVVLGTAVTSVGAGHTRRVRIALNQKGKRLLATFHTLTVKLAITEATSSGAQTTVASRTVAFKARPERRRSTGR